MLQILMPYLLIEQPHVLQLLVNLDIYVSLRLRVQNRRKKLHFPPNFRNGII